MKGTKLSKEEVVKRILEYRKQSEDGKTSRRQRNRFNWDQYNLKQDYSHKRRGQSREFFPKLATAVENFTSTALNTLTQNSDDWFTSEKGVRPNNLFKPFVVHNLLRYHLYRANAIPHIAAMMKNVSLDASVTTAVGGQTQSIPRFKMKARTGSFDEQLEIIKKVKGAKTKPVKRWHLSWELLDWEDFYPDVFPNPDGGIYEIQTVNMDLYKVHEMYEENPDVFDKSELNNVKNHFVDDTKEQEKNAKRDNMQTENYGSRKRALLTVFYGDLVDNDGFVHEDMKNVYAIIANDKYLIIPPVKNDSWDGDSPYVRSSLIEVHGSIFGKAIMDAAASLGKTYNEFKNLMLDGLFDAIKGIKQLKPGYLKNPAQASGDIFSGMTLHVEDDTPPGEDVIRKLRTGEIPQDAQLFAKDMEGEVREASMINEMKLGHMPAASSKATIAQMANQASDNIFNGIFRVFEDKCIVPLLEKSWLTILQNMDKESFADEEVIELVGKDRAAALLNMTPEERYLRGANAAKFRVRSISGTLQKVREYQKLTELIKIIGQNERLIQKFEESYDWGKFLGYAISAIGIKEDMIRLTEQEKAQMKIRNQVSDIIAQAQGEGGKTPGSRNANSVAPSPRGGRPPTATGDYAADEATNPQGPMEGNM